MTIRIGISGWNYPKWRGHFYPPGLKHREELAYASRQIDSIEINGSFYSLLRPGPVLRWYEETPPAFLFAVKGSRFISHMKRLGDVEKPLANFFASGLLALGAKLGPILWQLPPSFSFDAERLARFFDRLPRTMPAALELVREHDARLEGRAWLGEVPSKRIRYALEVRHPSFHHPDFVALLRAHKIALCVADTAGLFPDFEDVTAPFVYVRLHGHEKLYESGYPPRVLRAWAARIEAWARGSEIGGERLAAPSSPAPPAAKRDVFVYFDNDARVRAPFDAQRLRSLVQGQTPRRLPPSLASAGEPARTRWSFP